MSERGVILAGGSGTRFRPMTEVQSKAMLNVYDRPAIEYPLRTLRLMDCDSAVVVASPNSIGPISEYFKEGERVGLDLIYKVQSEPRGVADAMNKAKGLVNGVFPLLLADVFVNPVLPKQTEPTLFWTETDLANNHSVWSPEANIIVEKPKLIDIGKRAIIGYYYDERVFEFFESMTPAQSGELEIVDVHNYYREQGAQFVEHKGFFGDMGTPEGLTRVANHIWSHHEQ